GDFSGARKTREKALGVTKTLAAGLVKVTALNEVAFAQAEAEDQDTALATLRQTRQEALAIPDANDKGNALTRLLLAQTRLGDYEEALRTASNAGDFQMVALRLFAPFVKRESGQAGRKTLQQALEMVQANGSNSSPVDKRETLITLAAAQAS